MHSLVRNNQSGNLMVIMGIVNLLSMFALLGVYLYTDVIFKRPPITEDQERERIAAEQADAQDTDLTDAATIEFRPFTINIQPTVIKTPSGPKNKIHYAKMGFTLEVGNPQWQPQFENIRTQFLDRFIQIMSKKTFKEINTVQGRYILRSEILELVNRLMNRPLVTNVFFTEFIIQ